MIIMNKKKSYAHTREGLQDMLTTIYFSEGVQWGGENTAFILFLWYDFDCEPWIPTETSICT